MIKLPKKATCHPERREVRRGLCRPCYTLYRIEKGLIKAATCHPERKAHTNKTGLCSGCMTRRWREMKGKTDEGFWNDIREYNQRKLKEDPLFLRARGWKAKYGIDREVYFTLFTEQDGRCAICGETSSDYLCVDHCNETNVIRGLLCRACNCGIGIFKHDPDLLRVAVKYCQKAKDEKVVA